MFKIAGDDAGTDHDTTGDSELLSSSVSHQRSRSVTSGLSSLGSVPTTLSALSNYLSRHVLRRRLKQADGPEDEQKKLEVKARNRSDAAFREMFEAVDQNRDEKVDFFELKQHMDGLGMSTKTKAVRKLYNRIDRDNDGVITFEDFRMDWLERWKNPDDKRALLIGLFKLLDVTGDGVIELKEIKMVMMSIGEKVTNQEIDEMFKRFDKNGSGAIDQNEFIKAMMNHIDKLLPKESDVAQMRIDLDQRRAWHAALTSKNFSVSKDYDDPSTLKVTCL